MANTGNRGNMDIDNEKRRAPGSERTSSGSHDVHTQSDTQKSNQQTGQQKGQQNDKNRDM
jgi:hypothetical protein